MALFHATQALLAQGGAARLARRRTKGFESGDMTRKMAETSRGATVRNVPGTRSEARRSERSVTFVTLARFFFSVTHSLRMPTRDVPEKTALSWVGGAHFRG